MRNSIPSRGMGWLVAATCAISGAASSTASAAVIDVCGPNVCYEYDDAQAAVALMGVPTLVGDSMSFLPYSFSAQSTDSGWVTAGPAYFVFSRVYTVDPQHVITSFRVTEEFDYEIISGGPAAGSVEASLYLLAASNVLGTDSTSVTSVFSATGDSSGLQVSGVSAEIFPDAAFSGAANDMGIAVQNILRAYTSPDANGELAFIQKKFIVGTSTTASAAVIPLPATPWFLGTAFAALGLYRRRKASRP